MVQMKTTYATFQPQDSFYDKITRSWKEIFTVKYAHSSFKTFVTLIIFVNNLKVQKQFLILMS